MSPRLAFAIEAARQAGESTLGLFGAAPEVRLKDDGSPVTQADHDAEQAVRRLVAGAYPGEAVFGEEGGGPGPGEDRWVVDPIDGTKSYLAGVPLYATLLSYERAGEAVLGVCHFPALGETLWCEAGEPAFYQGEPCRVAGPVPLGRAVVATAGLSGLQAKGLLPGAAKLAAKVLAMRTWCDAYGHALVATGRAHAMLDPTVADWDVSAIGVIVKGAGGWFGELCGTGSAISAVPGMRDEILAEVLP